MKHEEALRPDWKEPALFLTSSLCFGTIWFSLLQLKMDMKHPNEDQSQTTLMFARTVCYVLGFGYCLPVTIVFGVAWFSYFFGCPCIAKDQSNSREVDAADECKETKLPVWFTVSACILCWIMVPLLWRLLNDDWGKVLKQPELHLFLVEVHIALHSSGFTTSLVLAISFALCALRKIRKKHLVTAGISPFSDVESVQPKL
ncbi:hypothetical protein DITRI_Ditri03aG0182200 [Diplodiscus trichospermus]